MILQLALFQEYLDANLIPFPNDPIRFGHQVVVDENDNILEEEKNMLVYAIDQNISQIEKVVHELYGLFIPAHINRPVTSLISQLGFVPSDINADALEFSRHTNKEKFLSQHP